MFLKYVGPFLRINKLKKETIKNQLFYLSKESLKHIVLYSGCGIKTSIKELKLKNISSSDINTFSSVSPLLCVYKKANPKLENEVNAFSWNPDKFKKEINIDSNALMTLSLFELGDYYCGFKDTDTKKISLGILYRTLGKKQLEFYTSYFRNDDGIFVDKIDASEGSTDKIIFVDKNKKFKFSTQAFLMAAFYKASIVEENKESENYRNFSFEILKMLIQYKEELYEVSLEELSKLCFGLNIFYEYSKNEQCKVLLLDLCELLNENGLDYPHNCMTYINSVLFSRNTGMLLFEKNTEKICSYLAELYDQEKGMFIYDKENKDITYECSDIVIYLICILLGSEQLEDSSYDSIIMDVFKRQLVDSGIILSWPEAPDSGDSERYRNFSMKAEDLLDDQEFRMPSIASPESNELAPVFTKSIIYNRKKEIYKEPKPSFDSYKNILVFFLILKLFKSDYQGSAI